MGRQVLLVVFLIVVITGGESVKYVSISPVDPVVLTGSDLNITCTLAPRLISIYNASSMDVGLCCNCNTRMKRHIIKAWDCEDGCNSTVFMRDSQVDFTLKNLPATLKGEAGIVCLCFVGDSQSSRTTIYTGYPPDPPVNFTCISYNQRTLVCSWSLPRKDYGAKSGVNVLLYYAKEGSQSKSSCSPFETGTTYSCTISSSFNTRYMLYLRMHNEFGTHWTNLSIKADYHKEKPNPVNVSDIYIKTLNSTALEVTWKPPRNFPPGYLDCLNGHHDVHSPRCHNCFGGVGGLLYELQYISDRWNDTGTILHCEPDVNHNENISRIITGLKPYSHYNIMIRVRPNGNGIEEAGYWSDESKVISDLTLEAAPAAAPEIIGLTHLNDGCELFWKDVPVYLQNGRIRSMNVTMTTPDGHICRSNQFDETYPPYGFNCTECGSEQSFIVYLNAATSAGFAKKFQSKNMDLSAGRVPRSFVAEYDGKIAILSWKTPPYGTPPESFSVAWCKGRYRNLCEDKLQYVSLNVDTMGFTSDGSRFQYNLSLSTEAQSYIFLVGANWQDASGKLEYPDCQQNFQYYGGVSYDSDLYLKSNEDNITLSWSPPNHDATNGYIMWYQVDVCEAGNNSTCHLGEVVPQCQCDSQSYGCDSSLKIQIQNLTASTNYTVTLTAYTRFHERVLAVQWITTKAGQSFPVYIVVISCTAALILVLLLVFVVRRFYKSYQEPILIDIPDKPSASPEHMDDWSSSSQTHVRRQKDGDHASGQEDNQALVQKDDQKPVSCYSFQCRLSYLWYLLSKLCKKSQINDCSTDGLKNMQDPKNSTHRLDIKSQSSLDSGFPQSPSPLSLEREAADDLSCQSPMRGSLDLYRFDTGQSFESIPLDKVKSTGQIPCVTDQEDDAWKTKSHDEGLNSSYTQFAVGKARVFSSVESFSSAEFISQENLRKSSASISREGNLGTSTCAEAHSILPDSVNKCLLKMDTMGFSEMDEKCCENKESNVVTTDCSTGGYVSDISPQTLESSYSSYGKFAVNFGDCSNNDDDAAASGQSTEKSGNVPVLSLECDSELCTLARNDCDQLASPTCTSSTDLKRATSKIQGQSDDGVLCNGPDYVCVGLDQTQLLKHTTSIQQDGIRIEPKETELCNGSGYVCVGLDQTQFLKHTTSIQQDGIWIEPKETELNLNEIVPESSTSDYWSDLSSAEEQQTSSSVLDTKCDRHFSDISPALPPAGQGQVTDDTTTRRCVDSVNRGPIVLSNPDQSGHVPFHTETEGEPKRESMDDSPEVTTSDYVTDIFLIAASSSQTINSQLESSCNNSTEAKLSQVKDAKDLLLNDCISDSVRSKYPLTNQFSVSDPSYISTCMTQSYSQAKLSVCENQIYLDKQCAKDDNNVVSCPPVVSDCDSGCDINTTLTPGVHTQTDNSLRSHASPGKETQKTSTDTEVQFSDGTEDPSSGYIPISCLPFT